MIDSRKDFLLELDTIASADCPVEWQIENIPRSIMLGALNSTYIPDPCTTILACCIFRPSVITCIQIAPPLLAACDAAQSCWAYSETT